MKRIFIAISALLLAALPLSAQVYLTKSYKPVEERKYYPHYPGVRGSDEYMYIATFRCSNGFHLWNGVTNEDAKKTAYAVFSLKGEYDKISFIMGPGRKSDDRWSAGDTSADILVVTGDKKKLLDEVVHCWEAPREVVLDVSGVDLLKFEDWSGLDGVYFGEIKLWKKGQTPTPYTISNAGLMAKDKVKLVEELRPHFICHRGWSSPITKENWSGIDETEYVSINRVKYYSGIVFSSTEELGQGISKGFAYFWLQRKFDKLSFIIGPRDNMSSNSTCWFEIKGDGRTIYEKHITQTDLAEQVVIDVTGVNVVSFHSGERESGDLLAGITFGVADIYAYKNGCPDIPTAGISNASKSKLAALPDVVKMCSNIEPFSIRGISTFDKTFFDGTSSHYHFSMGGEQFDEGFILATGTTLFFEDNIGAYYRFDVANEFDWVSFKVGTLTNHRVLDDDVVRVYADDQIILETKIHSTWPNQTFVLPIYKCRTLTFSKPGTGKSKQTYFGFGDITLYRGKPVANNLFDHPKPYCPETIDLIDLCKAPYFHYVGRYLSTLTNFDFNDCFKNGSTQREYFQMKDGSRIHKGVMLEANVPLPFEDISLTEAAFMFMMGAGSSISSSSVGAVTGVTAGAGLAGGAGILNLVGDGGRQSSVVAFNPFKEYETCTFTVANKSEYVDKDIFGAAQNPDNPVHLYVFADRVMVGDFLLTNRMQPATYSVPINKCEQLMFWLQVGDCRSGQYVLYDMTVSKTPMAAPAPKPAPMEVKPAAASSSNTKGKASKDKKGTERVVWDLDSRSGNEAIDTYLGDVTTVWNGTEAIRNKLGSSYTVKETWVQAQDGSVFKCVSLVDKSGNRLSTTDIQKDILAVMEECKALQSKASLAKIGAPGASIGIANLPFDKMAYFSKYVKLGSKALNQCSNDAKQLVQVKQMELDTVQSFIKKAVNVGQYKSTARVMIIPPEEGEAIPAMMQRLEYFSFQ